MATHPKVRALLISNSKCHGRDYFDHAEDAISKFLGEVRRVLFIPYALKDHDGYTKIMAERFARMGIELTSIHLNAGHPSYAYAQREAVFQAEAIFVGGGNTFRLTHALYHICTSVSDNLMGALRRRILSGIPYIGSSAGANLACPTIMTTNDMPIVQPERFKALGLVPFQINPHYPNLDPASTHMGETRDVRLKEYHEENDRPIVALREGAWLRVEGGIVTLEGAQGAKLFRRGAPPEELENGPIPNILLEL